MTPLSEGVHGRTLSMVLIPLLVALSAALTACGGGDSSRSTDAAPPPPPEIRPERPPASASDDRGKAPDDGISDRPGGPGSAQKSG